MSLLVDVCVRWVQEVGVAGHTLSHVTVFRRWQLFRSENNCMR